MAGRSTLKSEDGVAMTEFALVLPTGAAHRRPVVVRAGVFYWIEANHLANETARWAVVDRNPYGTSLQLHARDASSKEFQNVNVCIDFPKGAATVVGDPLRVRVQKPFSIFPLLNAGVTNITIKGNLGDEDRAVRQRHLSANQLQAGPPPSGQDVGSCS